MPLPPSPSGGGLGSTLMPVHGDFYDARVVRDHPSGRCLKVHNRGNHETRTWFPRRIRVAALALVQEKDFGHLDQA